MIEVFLHESLSKEIDFQATYFKNKQELSLILKSKEGPFFIFEEGFCGDFEKILETKNNQTTIFLNFKPLQIFSLKLGINSSFCKEDEKKWIMTNDFFIKKFDESYADYFTSSHACFLYRKDVEQWLEENYSNLKGHLNAPSKKDQKALFLDRDGIINDDSGYVKSWSDTKFYLKIFNLVRLANEENFLVFVVSNQSGIAREYFSVEEVQNLHQKMNEKFKEHNAIIQDWYFSPYHWEKGIGPWKKKSFLRKPWPGMILHIANKWGIDLNASYMLGDKTSDLFYFNMLKTFFIQGKYELSPSRPIFNNLDDFLYFFQKNLVKNT